MRLFTRRSTDEKYMSFVSPALAGWCCHCHCCFAADSSCDDGSCDDSSDPDPDPSYGGYELIAT